MTAEIVLNSFKGIGCVAMFGFLILYMYAVARYVTAENSHEFPGQDYGICVNITGFYFIGTFVVKKYIWEAGGDIRICILLDLIMLLLAVWATVHFAKRAHKSIQEAKQIKVTVRPEVGVVGRFVKGEITKEEMDRELEELQEEH